MLYKPKHGKPQSRRAEPNDEPLDPPIALLLEIISHLCDGQLLVVKKLAVAEARIDLVQSSLSVLAEHANRSGGPLETALAFDAPDE